MEPPLTANPTDELIPPASLGTVVRVGLAGVGACTAAAALGVMAEFALGSNTPPAVNTARLLLVGGGALLAGSAVSLRPSLWQGWALAAAAFLLAAVVGLPSAWDSARLLTGVMTVLFAVAAGLCCLSPCWRQSLLSVMVLFHFGGILTATTWPDPTPWLTNQIGHRVYMPYLSFLYLRNAYHFYSPEPGPASLLAYLITYENENDIVPETGKPKVEQAWVILPQRDQHMKDPLGQTYFRRLSITEMVSPSIPGLLNADNFEKSDVWKRRLRAGLAAGGMPAIPLEAVEGEDLRFQYRVPQSHITRYLLPSYAAHVAAEYSGPGRRVVSMKVYRIEHRITPVQSYVVDGVNVYHPRTYRPYYYGEYDPSGKLLNPQDEMLYWLIPITLKPGGPTPGDPNQIDYVDYLTKHAGYEFNWNFDRTRTRK